MKSAALLLFTTMVSCEAANILVMLPLPFYSHTSAYMPVIKELALRGHNVTLVSPFPQEKPVPNLQDIVVPKLYEEITDPSMFILKERDPLNGLKEFWQFGLRGSEAALKLQEVRKIISAPVGSFDLIITEIFFLLEPMAALSYKFRCPVVNLHPWSMTLALAKFTGNPLPSSYQPSVFTSFTDDMSLIQRTKNTLVNALELAGLHFYYLPRQDTIMRQYLSDLPGFENLPYITELLRNISLTLLDSHHALDHQKPYFRNVVEIGGLTFNNKQTVPKDLKNYMDESKQGFVYFSIGSHLPSAMLPENFRENLFKVFGKLKENVIMKWDNPEEPNKSKNVRIEKWLPQREVLGHKNCKLFITHGGLHAIQEATYNGVPLVGIPMVADQPINVRLAEQIGLGINVDIFQATEKLLYDSITTVLNEESYRKVSQERSLMLRDHPNGILENAIYHIEYIIKYHGAPHLRPAALQRYWYELILLDVVLLLVAIVILSFVTLIALVYFIKMILSTKKPHKTKKH